MLNHLLRSAEFSGLLKFVSPGFLRVLPPSQVFQVAGQLRRNRANPIGWRGVCSEYSELLSVSDLRVRIGPETAGSSDDPSSRSDRKAGGETALALYFHQMLTRETWILDFRSESFSGGSSDDYRWHPQPLYYQVSTEFLRGIRSLYRGYYGSDNALFEKALVELGLPGLQESLRDHFGPGDQTEVRFQLKTFQRTFARVFEACARDKLKLPRDFLVLGVALLGLYEQLESIGLPFDVRQAYFRAAGALGAS